MQADTGGYINLNGGPTNLCPMPLGTVTTTGDYSVGLYATGADGSGVASKIITQNVDVSTQGLDAHGVLVDNGAR